MNLVCALASSEKALYFLFPILRSHQCKLNRTEAEPLRYITIFMDFDMYICYKDIVRSFDASKWNYERRNIHSISRWMSVHKLRLRNWVHRFGIYLQKILFGENWLLCAVYLPATSSLRHPLAVPSDREKEAEMSIVLTSQAFYK